MGSIPITRSPEETANNGDTRGQTDTANARIWCPECKGDNYLSNPEIPCYHCFGSGRGTFEKEGLKWIHHTPGDPMPCAPGAKVRVLFSDGDHGSEHPPETWDWTDRYPIKIIGWYPIQGETPKIKLSELGTILEKMREDTPSRLPPTAPITCDGRTWQSPLHAALHLLWLLQRLSYFEKWREGMPCDGFRFRDGILEARKLLKSLSYEPGQPPWNDAPATPEALLFQDLPEIPHNPCPCSFPHPAHDHCDGSPAQTRTPAP